MPSCEDSLCRAGGYSVPSRVIFCAGQGDILCRAEDSVLGRGTRCHAGEIICAGQGEVLCREDGMICTAQGHTLCRAGGYSVSGRGDNLCRAEGITCSGQGTDTQKLLMFVLPQHLHYHTLYADSYVSFVTSIGSPTFNYQIFEAHVVLLLISFIRTVT